jgi:endonuclease III
MRMSEKRRRSVGRAGEPEGPYPTAFALHQHGRLRWTELFEQSVSARQWPLRFKGVGPNGAIVLLFSLGKPAFPVDTHIYRVSGRLGLRPANMSVEQAHEHLEALLPPETYYAAHLNIIRLGREVCQARRPNCPACPLQALCDYRQQKVSLVASQ